MTHKERMLAAIRGEPTDRIPWAPRLDLWCRAHRKAGTLPGRYKHATLFDLCDDLDMGFHAVVPDFQDLRSSEDDCDRALGIYNLRTMPCRTIFENVKRTVRRDGDRTIVEYDTPAGALRTATLYDETMRKAGITITHVAEYAFKGPADYAPLGFIFEHACVDTNYDGYLAFAEPIGDRGVAVAFAAVAASPMHLIQKEIMPLETFFFEMHDHPEQLAQLAQQIEPYWNRMLDVVSRCPAEVVFIGANYDASVQYPPFFAEHIRPWLAKAAAMLHRRGKYLLTHSDGENTGLLQHYVESGIDIADSICPAPMTNLSFKDVRDAFAGRITIMGGIPSVALLPSSMSNAEFEAYLDGFFEDIGDGTHLILGISDTTPPGADFDRIVKIGKRVDAFGPVGRP
ncbi:MAG: hypothetical protein AB1696_18770 [Planctomycetota bacterium]